MSELLTCVQVAARFGVTRQSVRNWARDGLLSASRAARGAWRFDPVDVAAFTPPRVSPTDRGCSTAGCDRPHHARGLCKREYERADRALASQSRRLFDLDDSGEL